MPRYLFGDFDHRAVVGAFRPDPETMRVEEPQFGLPLRAQTGATHRIGDSRTVAAGHTWLEAFRDRIAAEGIG